MKKEKYVKTFEAYIGEEEETPEETVEETPEETSTKKEVSPDMAQRRAEKQKAIDYAVSWPETFKKAVLAFGEANKNKSSSEVSSNIKNKHLALVRPFIFNDDIKGDVESVFGIGASINYWLNRAVEAYKRGGKWKESFITELDQALKGPLGDPGSILDTVYSDVSNDKRKYLKGIISDKIKTSKFKSTDVAPAAKVD